MSYQIGAMTLFDQLVLHEGHLRLSVWVVAAMLTAFLIDLLRRPSFPKNAPAWWRGNDWPIMGALRFYSHRASYMNNGFQHTSNAPFSFYIGQKHIIALAGDAGRRVFYDNKELKLAEGFAELLSGQPASPAEVERFGPWFSKMLCLLIKKDQFVRNLSAMTGDTRTMFENLGRATPSQADPEWRVMDPFEHLYRCIYQLTMRIVGAEEIADDSKLLDETLERFESFESHSSLTKVVFPWMITINHILRLYNGARLAMVIQRIIDQRKNTGKRREDALQFLLDDGASLRDIISFIIGALFAGLINSGINVAWLPILLSSNQEWMSRLRNEVDEVIAKRRRTATQSRADVLDTLTVEDWESAFPVADLCLRECIRFALPGAAFRKNVTGHDIKIDGQHAIPDGAFVTYLMDDVHFNEGIYSNPWTFDPGRFLDDRAEDRKGPHHYLGWGSGRHPCLGQRFARLENNIVLVYLVAMYDFERSDAHGNATPGLVWPERQLNTPQKPKDKVYLRYRARPEW